MIKINLLPIKELMRRRMLIQHAILGAIPIILAVVVILMVEFSIKDRVRISEKKIKVTKNQINKLDKIIGQINRLKNDKKELERKMSVIDKLNKNRTIPVHVLDELCNNIPEKLWLNSISQSGRQINLKGVGLDNETIVNFIKGLKKSEYFAAHINGLIKNFFNDSASQFASFFTSETNLSEKELEELREIVNHQIENKKN